ncbi:MAG: hypothetical protein ACPGD5_01040 [Salibacteraceae bacterium]
MKNFAIAIMLVMGLSSFAQNNNDYLEYSRTVLNAEKKAIVSEAMMLSQEQSKIFWPLYNELNEKLFQVESKTYAVIIDYAENIEKMTDEKADELWTKATSAQAERYKLLNSYYGKFKKVLPAGIVVKYFQVENKIDIMIDAALAMEIPLVEIQPAGDKTE